MKNKRIREALFETRTKVYELAQLLGTSEMTVYRKLRNELSEEEQTEIIHLIYQAHAKKGEGND